MINENQTEPLLTRLNNPRTIREQAHRLLKLAKDNQLTYFAYHPEKMLPTASFVIEVTNSQYPDFNIPYHSRWRHLEIGGIDRVKQMLKNVSISVNERGIILYELIIISVLLDAGAGELWCYKDPSNNQIYNRSEGLALASLALYQQGLLSANPTNPFRVDAQRLIDFTEADLRQAFQVKADNPLEGVSGRVKLLNQLGSCIKKNQDYFGKEARLGSFYTYVSSLTCANVLEAKLIFQSVLKAFNTIWPNRLNYQGVALGDVWIHPALKANMAGAEYIPFHKLSQWLTYSLIEPLEQAGIQVSHLDELTGLPEYRNGGLFIDMGLISLKDEAFSHHPHKADAEIIIEWRALTVALLDELAVVIRQKLKLDEITLPLTKILQGGTWEAGRRIAKAKRKLGTPPLQIISDGTVF